MDDVFFKTMPGLEKMPDPMMDPTIRDKPSFKPRLFGSVGILDSSDVSSRVSSSMYSISRNFLPWSNY
jgi:hypothetical protein